MGEIITQLYYLLNCLTIICTLIIHLGGCTVFLLVECFGNVSLCMIRYACVIKSKENQM